MEAAARFSLFDLVDGFFASHVAWFFWVEGLWAHVRDGGSPRAWAEERSFDPDAVRLLLEYLRTRTDLLEADADRLAPAYRDGPRLGHLFDKYIGAFGPCARDLRAVLSSPAEARRLVDRRRHAAAFLRVERPSFPALPSILRQFGVRRLLDLGCGAGSLLRELASQDGEFLGVGVDENPEMLAAAGAGALRSGFDDRLWFIEGSLASLEPGLLDRVPFETEALSACSVLNEFFSGSPPGAAAVLRSLQSVFPGRLLFIADYYGRLGTQLGGDPSARAAVLHDVVQTISGQGVPPATAEAWQRIYATSGCTWVHGFEGEGGTTPWFIHLVRL